MNTEALSAIVQQDDVLDVQSSQMSNQKSNHKDHFFIAIIFLPIDTHHAGICNYMMQEKE